MTQVNRELSKLHEKKSEGAKIRSRIRWFDEGEKPTKYFHNLEKRNAKDKAWNCILDNSKNPVYNTEQILKRQVEYYKGLYKSTGSDEEMSAQFLNSIDKCVSEDTKCALNQDVTIDELTRALKSMRNNKSPGPDGIITEFYKIYWKDLGKHLSEIFRVGFETENLPYSQYLAIIILIYKKGDRNDIKNWRPISLLNTDVKILSKVLATRLKRALPEIINVDQKGCIEGRFIGQNIRLVEDILETHDDDEILLLIDQEKAFDRVEWSWLNKVLHRYGVGDNFIKWIKIIYASMKSAVLTNGILSSYFDISRGIRQGDSLSALLYVIQAEPLAEYIRRNGQLEGIKIKTEGGHEKNVRCCQYVDDTVFFLNNPSEIDKYLAIMDKFGLASGSRINKMKTIGLAVNRETVETHQGEIQLTLGPEKILGVPLGKNCSHDKFWNELIEKTQKQLYIWKSRNLSYDGKVHLIKSLGVSRFMYACEMKTIDTKYIQKIDRMLWDFLWSGKKMQIKKAICQLPKSMGGLNMIDILTCIKVRRIKWVIRFLQEDQDQVSNIMPMQYLKCLDKYFDITLFALRVDDTKDFLKCTKIPSFYKECISNYQELCYKGRVREPDEDEIIWCNKKLKFNNSIVCFPHWAKSGIKFISHVIEDGRVKEHEILSKLKKKAGYFFEIKKLVKSMPEEWKQNTKLKHNCSDINQSDLLKTKFQIPRKNMKCLKDLTAKDIYRILTLDKTPEIKSKEYWQNKLNNDEIDFDCWFRNNFENKLTERKCLDFNWRIFHGQVMTENKLQHMKLSNGKRKLCKKGENLDHILMLCNGIDQVWKMIQSITDKLYTNRIKIDKQIITCGTLKSECEELDMILSMCRWIIWKRRCKMKYELEFVAISDLLRFCSNQ